MPAYQQTPEDLRQHLREHVEWLEESMASFDAGKEHSAKRLAATMRTLLHETDSSHSLLGQLGVRESLRFWSVLPDFGPAPTDMFQGIGMEVKVENGSSSIRYIANLGRPEQKLPVSVWWDGEPIIIAGTEIVTRRRAVLQLTNKDGGAHIDPKLNELDHKLLRTDLMGWQGVTFTGAQETVVHEAPIPAGPPGMVMRVSRYEGGQATQEPSGLGTPVNAVVRQAAHELHGTLREQLHHLLT